MGVVGDIVGDGGDLRLHAREAPQLQVLHPGILQDRLGNAPRAVALERRSVPGRERTVMLDEALERFPGQIEPVERRIVALQSGDHAQGLCVVIEPAEDGEAFVESALSRMAEGRVPQIMGKRQRLGEILVQPQCAGECAGDLRDLERMGEPRAVMVALVEHEHLGFVLEPAEGGRMDDAVAVAAKGAAAFAGRLGVQPAAALLRIARIGCPRR